jgi:tetratricopeptide (TPR) repeat protein
MHPDAVLLEFYDAVDADLASGGLRAREDYVRRFPAHAARIRGEYQRLTTPEPALERLEAAPAAARLLGERYRLIAPLGRGGFGEVYLAEDEKLARKVAIKVLGGLRALSEEWCARLVREAELTNRIADDGLCVVHDVGFDAGVPFLVMPWVPGHALDRLLAESASLGEGPVALGDGASSLRERRDAVLLLLERLARSLQSVHDAGVVHRDVKPANILVRPDGRAVLIDFGLAWLADAGGEATRSGAFGTPAYLAPEALGAERVLPDPRLDVWSLGVVLFEALALRRPFAARPGGSLERAIQEEPLPRLDPRLGRDLQAVLETALARRPDQRYASMRAFAEDLARVRRGEPVSVRAAGPLARGLARLRARPRAAALAFAAAAALLCALVLGTTAWSRARERRVVSRAIATLAESLAQTVRDTEQLARFGLPLERRRSEAEKLLASARDLRDGVGASPEIDRGLAHTLIAAGALHIQLGDPALAEQLLEALALLRALPPRSGPDHDEDRATLSHALILLGDTQQHRERFEQALVHFREAFAIDAALLAERPEDPKRVSDVGYGHLRLGLALRLLERSAEAEAELRRALAHLRRAEALDPERPERRVHTAEALHELASALILPLRDAAEPRALLDEAEEKLRAETERMPQSAAAWMRRLNAAGLRLNLTAEPAARIELSQRGVDAARRIRLLEPLDPLSHVKLSGALRRLANVRAAAGELDAAAEAAYEALSAATRSLELAPEVPIALAERTASLATCATVERVAGRLAAAEALTTELLALAEEQWQRSPRDASALVRFAKVLLDPALGERVDPQRVRDLLARWRADGKDIGSEIELLERRVGELLR